MRIIPLYRYQREDGGITVSPNKPSVAYTDMVRLVADDGKVLLYNGKNHGMSVDVYNAYGWTEIDDPEPMEDEGLIER